MHTLFMREHNRLATELVRNGSLTVDEDEEIYQAARKIVGAELQIITYEEFLPALLGAMTPDTAKFEYKETVNPSITNEFSAALYRLGHSMLPNTLEMRDADGNLVDGIDLGDAFFNPDFFIEDPTNLDRLLQGFLYQLAEEIDNMVVDGLRNMLIDGTGSGVMDLASINIQRGRDHGLPDYNQLRAAYGLPTVTKFGQISSVPSVQQSLCDLYGDPSCDIGGVGDPDDKDSGIDNIDPWVGALAEDHLPGTSVGQLIAESLVEQFIRTAEGDRFFYLWDADFTGSGPITAAATPTIDSVIDPDQINLANLLRWNSNVQPADNSVFFTVVAPGTLVLLFPSALIGLLSWHRGNRRRL